MKPIIFSVPGEPRGKGKGKPVQRGPHLAIITDDTTLAYQNKIAGEATRAMAAVFGQPYQPLEGPIELRLLIRIGIPTSASARKKQQMRDGVIKPTRKPDSDNVTKAVKDGCKAVVWRDDVQVTTLWVRKVYADLPGLDVRIAPDLWAPAPAETMEAA